MNKKFLAATLVFIIVLFVGIMALNKHENKLAETVKTASQNTEIILYYGEGCPHCEKVDEFIATNNIKDKIQFSSKEVFLNQANAQELGTKAKICGIDSGSVGVPFLWDGSKCIIGDEDIINFFKTKAGIQ